MKVIRARVRGFAGGWNVRLKLPERKLKEARDVVYTDGPLIHNKQMMNALSKEDVQEVGDYQSSQDLDLQTFF